MPKKKAAAAPPQAELIPKPIKWPKDWIERIDAARGDVSFADFVRNAVMDQVGREGLSEIPGWGMGRWKDKQE